MTRTRPTKELGIDREVKAWALRCAGGTLAKIASCAVTPTLESMAPIRALTGWGSSAALIISA